MKKIIPLLLFSAQSVLFAQNNISLQYMPTLATFKYTDSQGDADPNMRSAFKSSVGASYTHTYNSGFFIRPEIGAKNMGATSALNNAKLDWSLNYLDFNLGIGYIKYIKALAPYIGASPYISYLYKARQTVGTTYYDLISNKGLKQNDIGINLFAGLRFRTSEIISLFVEVRNSMGLTQLEASAANSGSEKLYNRAVSFQLGMSFTLLPKYVAKRRTNF